MANDSPPIGQDRIEQAATKLRAVEREALSLHARGDLSSAEIAWRLGVSEAELAPLVAGALLKLDRALARQERPWWRFW